MTQQISVRLPVRLVELLDQAVVTGQASSRAELVTSALERELRLRLAEHDAEILRATGPEDDLDDLVDWAFRRIDLED